MAGIQQPIRSKARHAIGGLLSSCPRLMRGPASQVQGFAARGSTKLRLWIGRSTTSTTAKEHRRRVSGELAAEEDRSLGLRTEHKASSILLEMIAYRAETSIASLLREHLAAAATMPRRCSARSSTPRRVDTRPRRDTLTVRLHRLTQAAHDQAIEQMLADLNATQTSFPGTTLTLVFKLGSS